MHRQCDKKLEAPPLRTWEIHPSAGSSSASLGPSMLEESMTMTMILIDDDDADEEKEEDEDEHEHKHGMSMSMLMMMR